MKSQAVLSDGAGMPGVSGDENVQGVPTLPRCAKEPGVVPCFCVDGLSPSSGSVYEGSHLLGMIMSNSCGRASEMRFAFVRRS